MPLNHYEFRNSQIESVKLKIDVLWMSFLSFLANEDRHLRKGDPQVQVGYTPPQNKSKKKRNGFYCMCLVDIRTSWNVRGWDSIISKLFDLTLIRGTSFGSLGTSRSDNLNTEPGISPGDSQMCLSSPLKREFFEMKIGGISFFVVSVFVLLKEGICSSSQLYPGLLITKSSCFFFKSSLALFSLLKGKCAFSINTSPSSTHGLFTMGSHMNYSPLFLCCNWTIPNLKPPSSLSSLAINSKLCIKPLLFLFLFFPGFKPLSSKVEPLAS